MIAIPGETLCLILGNVAAVMAIFFVAGIVYLATIFARFGDDLTRQTETPILLVIGMLAIVASLFACGVLVVV